MEGKELDITENDLIEALRQAAECGGDAEGAISVDELRVALGWGKTRIREILRDLKMDGRLEIVWVPSESLDGKRIVKPAYRLVDKQDI